MLIDRGICVFLKKYTIFATRIFQPGALFGFSKADEVRLLGQRRIFNTPVFFVVINKTC